MRLPSILLRHMETGRSSVDPMGPASRQKRDCLSSGATSRTSAGKPSCLDADIPIRSLPMDNIGASYLAGVDIKTGKNRWKIARPRDHNWASPLLVPQGDRAQVLIGAVTGLTAYDARSGKELWAVPSSGFSNIATPVLGD